MNGINEVQIFFIISSIGFVLLWILIGVLLFYVIRVVKTFERIISKVEVDINKVGDITREMFEDMKESMVWNFIFRKKKRTRKEKTDSN